MNIQKTLIKIDKIQRRYSPIGFTIGVIKKYGDDQCGYKAALLTYYGYLSLFPLLLVATTVLQIVANSHIGISNELLNNITGSSSVLGGQLSVHVTSLHRSGLALAIGLLFLLYGARGVAAAFRTGVNDIWGITRSQQLGFPQSAINNTLIVVIGGLGFIATAFITGTVAALGHGILPRVLSYLAGVLLLYLLFTYLIRAVLPKHINSKDTYSAALSAAFGLIFLQIVGGLLLTKLLKNLDALYSYFAISLGLLFWLYLQAQVIYYSVVIAAVKTQKLWPRSFSGLDLTDYDQHIIQTQKTRV